MSIDFSNVHLTIQQFQSVSDGKFNAGEVRLTSETGIEKINNFVGRKWKNKESISHAEVIAIKQAFVKALQQGGVGEDALRRVREQLGLAPDKAVDTKLSERSLKPLSRQQIREILDQNAEAINRTVGQGTIRTSAELNAGVEDKTLRYRETKRNTTNAELSTRRTVTTERKIGLFQALVAGDVDFRSGDDRAELLTLANDALDLVLVGAGGHPRAGIPAKVVLNENGESRIEMETGMDEVAFVRKLEDSIVRLQGPGPGADVIALRDEFRAVPREERARWINDMVDGGGDNVWFKVRTLVVSLLQDAGVDDYDSLSLPNRLPDAAATALLRNLAGLPDDATAEQTRQCLEMVRDMAEAEPRPHPAYVPATSPRSELTWQIGKGTPPPAFAQALVRALQVEDIRVPSGDPNVEGRTFSPEEAVAVFSAETKLGKALAEILESFPDELTPNTLEILARGALHHHGIGDVAQILKSIREKYADELNSGHFFNLPANLVNEAQGVLAEMRARFGAEWVPEGASYNQVVDLSHLGARLRQVARAAGNEGRFMTVAEFRQAAETEAEDTLVEKVVAQEVRAVAEECGAGAMPGGFVNAILKGNPGLKAALLAAKTPDEVRAAVENARGTIRAAVELEARIAPLVRGAKDAMAEKLAARFHITAADAKRRFGYDYYLSIRLGEFKIDVQNGRYPGCREPGFSAEAAVNGIIDRFVGQYAEKLAIVDSLQGVSGETRDALKAIVQKQSRPDRPFVDAARAQKIAAKLDGAALLAALDAPDATDESRFEAIRKYADDLYDAIKAEFPGKTELGTDEFLPVLSLVRTLLIGSVPGLGAALERLSNDPFALRVGPHFQQKEHQDHPLRATVASTLI